MIESIIGSLHDPKNIDKLVAAGLSDEMKLILEEGVSAPISDIDAMKKLQRPNNRSALDNVSDVQIILKKWLRKGIIKKIDKSEAEMILPLTLDFKYDLSKQAFKRRLCLDCKPINKFIESPALKVSSSYLFFALLDFFSVT